MLAPRRALSLAALVTSLVGCPAPSDPGRDTSYACEANDATCPVPELADVEVILTDPYCDRCTQADKDVLRTRSPIVARVVDLLDHASQSIDIAQFTFSDETIAEAVLRAHQRGVTVRLAMDAKQDQPGTRATELFAAGVDVRFVSAKPYADKVGLQHAKFIVVDGTTLLTGSNNFSSTGTSINEENTIVLRDAPDHPVTSGFRCHFEAIWEGDWENAGACTNDQVLFTPSSAPFKRLRDEIRDAERRVDVIMHHLTFDDLVKELTKAAERGVRVRVLLNATTRQEHSGGRWDELVQAGGLIRYKQVNEDAYQLLHHKLVIIDDHLLINGSGNWSGSAFFNNFENYVVWEHPRVLQPFRALYHRLWTWSLDGAALDAGIDAATQHAGGTSLLFGNLHAHFHGGGGELDDGEAEVLDAHHEPVPFEVGGTTYEAATQAFATARQAGMDFMALTPHCHDELPEDDMPNMSPEGFEEVTLAAADQSDGQFVALAGMEWSTNSTGNHVGIYGSSAISKVERGRYDRLYGDFLLRRELAAERPFVALNHPRTFRWHEEYLNGNWDMIFDVNLLDIPKAGERDKKFNDFGLDDFSPLREHRQGWIAGDAMPDPAVVDATIANLWGAASPYVRLMEVTFNRGKEFGGMEPQNPSMTWADEAQTELERRTKVHRDFDWFLTRGFRIAPIASHDNHYANWGYGHTSRTVICAAHRSEQGLLDAIEHREVYASEDQNLRLRFYAEGRVPMGSRWATPSPTVDLRVDVADPDYAGGFSLVVYGGVVGRDGVESIAELHDLDAGSHELTVSLDEPGEHFVYVEVHEVGSDRMAWSAPIWIERL